LERNPAARIDCFDGWRPHECQGGPVRDRIHEAGRHRVSAPVPALRDGQTIPKAVFEFYRADGDGKPICYFKLELENVMISSFHPNSGNGGIIKESVHLAYAKIKATYTQQKIAGGAGGSTAGGWDAAANKVYA
jgi:hypothetical protein